MAGSGLASVVTAGMATAREVSPWETSVGDEISDLARSGTVAYGATVSGTLFGVDASSGTRSAVADGGEGSQYTAVAAGKESVAAGTEDGTLHCYTRSLSTRWKLPLAGRVAGVTVADGTILATAGDTLYALGPDAETLWKKQLNTDEGLSTPAVGDGTVYVQEGLSSDVVGLVYAFDLQSGSKLWDTNGPTASQDDYGFKRGFVQLSPDGSRLIARASKHQQFGDFNDGIAVVDTETGVMQWRTQAAKPFGATAVSNEAVFTDDGGLTAYALTDGSELWRLGENADAVTYADGTVYYKHVISSRYGDKYRVRAIDSTNRTVQWETSVREDHEDSIATVTPERYVLASGNRVVGYRRTGVSTTSSRTASAGTGTDETGPSGGTTSVGAVSDEGTTRETSGTADRDPTTSAAGTDRRVFLHPSGGFLTGRITGDSAFGAVIAIFSVLSLLSTWIIYFNKE